jgi:hypothetical protein
MLANPCWLAPAIDNCIYCDDPRGVSVINSERKSAAEKPMEVAVSNPVNASGNAKPLDICLQRRKEVVAQAGSLNFVEAIPLL